MLLLSWVLLRRIQLGEAELSWVIPLGWVKEARRPGNQEDLEQTLVRVRVRARALVQVGVEVLEKETSVWLEL